MAFLPGPNSRPVPFRGQDRSVGQTWPPTCRAASRPSAAAGWQRAHGRAVPGCSCPARSPERRRLRRDQQGGTATIASASGRLRSSPLGSAQSWLESATQSGPPNPPPPSNHRRRILQAFRGPETRKVRDLRLEVLSPISFICGTELTKLQGVSGQGPSGGDAQRIRREEQNPSRGGANSANERAPP
jgi:hypothetical protein